MVSVTTSAGNRSNEKEEKSESVGAVEAVGRQEENAAGTTPTPECAGAWLAGSIDAFGNLDQIAIGIAHVD